MECLRTDTMTVSDCSPPSQAHSSLVPAQAAPVLHAASTLKPCPSPCILLAAPVPFLLLPTLPSAVTDLLFHNAWLCQQLIYLLAKRVLLKRSHALARSCSSSLQGCSATEYQQRDALEALPLSRPVSMSQQDPAALPPASRLQGLAHEPVCTKSTCGCAVLPAVRQLYAGIMSRTV